MSQWKYLTDDEAKEASLLFERGERVDWLYDMISNLRYQRGKTGKELSQIFCVSRATMDQYASEAHRRFKAVLGDTEDLRGLIIQKISTIVDDAMEATIPMMTKEGQIKYGRKPDHRSAIQGLVGIGELCGLKVRKHEHKIRYEEYSKESLEALVEKSKKLLAEQPILTLGESADGQPQEVNRVSSTPRIIDKGEPPIDGGLRSGEPGRDGN